MKNAGKRPGSLSTPWVEIKQYKKSQTLKDQTRS